MKKLILIVLILSSCTRFETKQTRAEKLITQYLKSNLNDPNSYESVSFSQLYKLKDTVIITDGKPDSIKHNGWLEIAHAYRGKNQFGGVITKHDWFQVDSNITLVHCCFVGQHWKEAGIIGD